ncbi:hypothetical protein UY3_02237 [Chelonia mydas]|uniref:Uncharacterized protein n=3 Tax=Cheloniidae TaxID=8465 RepID=M7BTF7_CHEMY|nr:hypothetical protein UY3_02237 [Chelonia mydas]
MKRSQWRYAKDSSLSNFMKIAIDGPTINEFDFALAIEYYESLRESDFIMAQVK